MPAESYADVKERLEQKKVELTVRLDRITQNLRRGYHPDSKERAKELEDSEVVDALGNEARAGTQQSRCRPATHGGRRIRTMRPVWCKDRSRADRRVSVRPALHRLCAARRGTFRASALTHVHLYQVRQ